MGEWENGSDCAWEAGEQESRSNHVWEVGEWESKLNCAWEAGEWEDELNCAWEVGKWENELNCTLKEGECCLVGAVVDILVLVDRMSKEMYLGSEVFLVVGTLAFTNAQLCIRGFMSSLG